MDAIARNAAPSLREDYVAAEDYISPEFAKLEKDRLWTRAWLMAGREEELPEVGSYITFEIADQSVTILRAPDQSLKAFHNVCPHRGRKLTAGCGRMGKFFCKYHGWKWDLDGNIADVVDRQDWGDALQDEDIALQAVRLGTWGGWIFICMDEETESLEDWLETVPQFIDPFDFASMRYKFRLQAVLPANWKVSLEAFTEGYHVQTTHPQILEYSSDYTYSKGHGRHGHFGYAKSRPLGLPSPRLTDAPDVDMRRGILENYKAMRTWLNTMYDDSTISAAERLLTEVPEDAPHDEVIKAFWKFNMEEHASRAVPWPDGLTLDKFAAAGTSWHLFPNMVFLVGPGFLLGYRARPTGDNPDSCIYDVYALERYPEGEAPPTPEVSVRPDIASEADWGLVLIQDFMNMNDIQQGMKSKSFKGSLTSPVQEKAVSNFHHALREFIGAD